MSKVKKFVLSDNSDSDSSLETFTTPSTPCKLFSPPPTKKAKNVTSIKILKSNVASQTLPPQFDSIEEKVRYSLASIYGQDTLKVYDSACAGVKNERKELKESVCVLESAMKTIGSVVENVQAQCSAKNEKPREKEQVNLTKEKKMGKTSKVRKNVYKRCAQLIGPNKVCPYLERSKNMSHHWPKSHKKKMPEHGWTKVLLTAVEKKELDDQWEDFKTKKGKK